jgi:hypothetical protein
MDHCLPSAWNGSWNGALDNPSAARAVSAMTCAIGAACVIDDVLTTTSHNFA